MRKVEKSSLEMVKGKYCDSLGVFTGVAMSLEEGGLEVATIIDGVEQHEGNHDLFLYTRSRQAIDSRFLEPEYIGSDEAYSYGGVGYSGVAFEFHLGACIKEMMFENGLEIDYVEYFPNGEVQELLLVDDDGFSQEFVLYESGVVKSARVFAKNLFDAGFYFSEAGDVEILNISRDYFSEIARFVDRLIFPIHITESFSDKQCAQNLKFSGQAFDDELINSLLKGRVSDIKTLWVWDTRLSSALLGLFSGLERLKELHISSDILCAEDIEVLRTSLPNCEIHYENRATDF